MVSLSLTYKRAAEMVESHAKKLGPRSNDRLALLDAQGRILATPIVADRDQPPFDRATRDGFACRAEDACGPLRVIGMVRAGEVWRGKPLAAGEAVEIMTGAPVPPGANCVVMVEHVTWTEDRIHLGPGRRPCSGENIVPAGAEARASAVVVPGGTRMGQPQIAAAAACGYSQVEVFARPRIAILATGDELVDVADVPLPHQIRNSNSYTLSALVVSAGGEPMVLPIARDERGPLKESIETALACDLVLLSGGVSMGKYDLVEEVLLGLGAEFLFTGVEIQPGRPAVFGHVNGKYFFGLPGNPVSTMVTFLLFAAPMVRRLTGELECSVRFVQAKLTEPIKVKAGLTRFLPARLNFLIDCAQVSAIAWQGSGDLAATARANCFLVVPPDRNEVGAGDAISVLLI